MYLSIIIPAYNEQQHIQNTLAAITSYIKENNIDTQIIVVDDGSSDNTLSIIKNFSDKSHKLTILQNQKNQGKGFSVRRGMLAAKGEYILFTDADNSTPIEEIKKLLSPISDKKYDVTIGSRALEKSIIKIRQPILRVAAGKTFNLIIRLLLYKDFRDTQCGFKCFSQKAAKEIFELQRCCGFAFDAEILAIAKLKGFRITEIPIVWTNCLPSRVHPVKNSIHMFFDVLRIKWNLCKKIYG